ncbi:MAG: SpoIIE family protein phosphatase [Candidatus Baltobacteraceae bacterium]
MDTERTNVEIDERIARRLADSTALVRLQANALFTEAKIPQSFPDRFMDIYQTLLESWPGADMFQSGWHAGMASAHFFQSQHVQFHRVIRELEDLRNRLFFGCIPELLEPQDRERYFIRLGTFLTAYIRGMLDSSSVEEYREIGEVARRLTLAGTPDHLEREAVAGIARILDVDYAWFTHRESGVWNISHATTDSNPVVRAARMRDNEVDGIERLLEGAALIYEDIETCAPAMRNLGKVLRLRSALSVPVMNRGVCVGTIGVGRRKPSNFTEHDLAIVRLVASQTAAATNEKQAAQDMRLALAGLQDSEAKLRVLAEAIPQIVWTAQPDGAIDWYNHRWYEYTGQSHAQAKGWGWQEVHHPEDLPVVMERWPHSIHTGSPFEMEFRLRGRDGTYRWFLTRVLPVENDTGQIIKWYGTNTDIDEQKQAMRRKDEIAQTLQQVFIPKAFPVTKVVSFDAVYLPAENDAQVGGDWYDAFELPDGKLVFSIGDVAGHGLEAALTMGKIRQNIFGAALGSADPSVILNNVNRVLLLQDAIMATAIVGIIDADGKSVTYACAGHPPPVLADAQGTTLLQHGGLALGIQESLDVSNQTFHPQPGSLLVLYTDGITESERKIVDGEKRLLKAVQTVYTATEGDMPALRIHDLTFVHRKQNDDVAILAIRFLGAHNSGGVSSIQNRPFGMSWDFNSSDADAAQRARRQVVEYVRRTATGKPDLFAVESIIGELIANTVDHAPGPVHIDIDWTAQSPTLSVHDKGISFDHDDLKPPGPLSEEGRGLFIIHALGSGLRVQRNGAGGKAISVLLPVRRTLS